MPVVERDDVHVYYEVVGDGPAVVLLPGAGADGSSWRESGYLDELVGEYRCVTVDPRGFGRSSRPADPDALRVEELAADVLAVAAALELDRFALWGQSAGGVVAITLAAAHPSQVTGVVGSGAWPPLDESEWMQWRTGARDVAASFRAAESWKDLIEGAAAQEGRPSPKWLGETDCDLEMGARIVERLPGERHHPEWLRLETPCLFLLGELEILAELETDPAWVEKAKRLQPHAQIVVHPGLGHVGGIFAREQTMAHVRPFLARIATAA